jgi:large subunit ribosomal protein L15|uniref:Large ribosomal subunit protein uL15 n=1 Tax=Ignisphaera aggregans TaxID=334771 RepID=A0A7J2TA99_9CREN
MVVRKEKKSRKMHGYRNRGWGNVGQHRRSGSRGGRGAAGMHKHKWTWVIKYFRDWFGKEGFTSRKATIKVSSINLNQLNELVTKILQSGTAIVEDGKIVINLAAMGINKVLGEGTIEYPIKVLVHGCSKKAREKIERMGGVVQLLGFKT